VICTEMHDSARIDRQLTGREPFEGIIEGFGRLFRKAQRKVERCHFRDRKALMYFEKHRKKMQRQMGQDPYLDTPN